MRVWLLDEKTGANGTGLEALLRQLEERPGVGLRLVGASPFQADFTLAMRKLVPDVVDILVINERICPDGPWVQEILDLGMSVVAIVATDRLDRFRDHAAVFPITFASPNPGVDALLSALVTAMASQRRELQWKAQISRLQQRLEDRIVIERAKGILVQRLKITEEDAYKRLRLLSRRQRRQIRDIAQSLLDTQFLLSSETNGFGKPAGADLDSEPENQLPAH